MGITDTYILSEGARAELPRLWGGADGCYIRRTVMIMRWRERGRGAVASIDRCVCLQRTDVLAELCIEDSLMPIDVVGHSAWPTIHTKLKVMPQVSDWRPSGLACNLDANAMPLSASS